MSDLVKRTESSITKVDPAFLSYLQAPDDSLKDLAKHTVLPRVKMVQSSSRSELKDKFGEGTAVLLPGEGIIARYVEDDPGFLFVPAFFFVEYALWYDLKDPDGKKMPIKERTYDPSSQIAINAQDPDKRMVIYAGDENKPAKQQKFWRYVTHLRFPGLIYGDHPLSMTPIVLSFERGEYPRGESWITAIKMRKLRTDSGIMTPPLWMQTWKFQSALRNGDDGDWFGFDFTSPTEEEGGPLVRAEDLDMMKSLHEDFKVKFQEARLSVYEDTSSDPESSATAQTEDDDDEGVTLDAEVVSAETVPADSERKF